MSEQNVIPMPNGNPKPPKKIVSEILSEKRQWVDARLSKPDPGVKVVIRMSDPAIIFAETETEILPSEDEKIAEWVRDINDPNNGDWRICPPYPRYDYSPLSQKEQINPDTVVTHWAIPEAEEVEFYESRFNIVNTYKKLNLEVDEQHEADVYRALLWGAAFIQKANPNDPQAMYLATVLYDLQYILDTRRAVDLTDEAYEAAVEKKLAEQEARAAKEAAKFEHYESHDPNEDEPEDNDD